MTHSRPSWPSRLDSTRLHDGLRRICILLGAVLISGSCRSRRWQTRHVEKVEAAVEARGLSELVIIARSDAPAAGTYVVWFYPFALLATNLRRSRRRQIARGGGRQIGALRSSAWCGDAASQALDTH